MMFKRVKVMAMLIAVLSILGLLQLISGVTVIQVLQNDKKNFSEGQLLNATLGTFTDAWINLNQARITVSRSMLRLQRRSLNMENLTEADLDGMVKRTKEQLAATTQSFQKYKAIEGITDLDAGLTLQLEERYYIFFDALDKMADLLAAHEPEQTSKQGAEGKQNDLQETYARWRILVVIALSWMSLRVVLLKPLRTLMDNIGRISDGDLTKEIDTSGNNEISKLACSLNTMQNSLVRTVSAVRNGTDSIYSGVSDISAGSNDLSSRTEQQAAALEQTAASMEELTATVKQNADNARQASQLALNASGTAEKGGKVVDSVVNTMKDIESSSSQIAQITK